MNWFKYGLTHLAMNFVSLNLTFAWWNEINQNFLQCAFERNGYLRNIFWTESSKSVGETEATVNLIAPSREWKTNKNYKNSIQLPKPWLCLRQNSKFFFRSNRSDGFILSDFCREKLEEHKKCLRVTTEI